MKVRIIIEYVQDFEAVTKIVSDLSDDRLDFHTESSLHSIPKEWIKKIEILDDEDL